MSAGPAPPSGTVTMLFTDVEGSTRLLRLLGERYGDLLAEHRRILREAFAAHGGREMDTQGDAFFVAFSRARNAVEAAVGAQRALVAHEWPDVECRVRMGLHTGEPTVRDEGYHGMGLHRGARIAGVAHGGQILLSGTTADLIRDDLPEQQRARRLMRASDTAGRSVAVWLRKGRRRRPFRDLCGDPIAGCQRRVEDPNTSSVSHLDARY